MEISSTFWLPDIADWWHQQEERHSKYTDLSNVVRDVFSIIPHGATLEASVSFGQEVIGWRQSKTKGETSRKEVIVKQFARATIELLASDDPALDTTSIVNDMDMKREAEPRTLH